MDKTPLKNEIVAMIQISTNTQSTTSTLAPVIAKNLANYITNIVTYLRRHLPEKVRADFSARDVTSRQAKWVLGQMLTYLITRSKLMGK